MAAGPELAAFVTRHTARTMPKLRNVSFLYGQSIHKCLAQRYSGAKKRFDILQLFRKRTRRKNVLPSNFSADCHNMVQMSPIVTVYKPVSFSLRFLSPVISLPVPAENQANARCTIARNHDFYLKGLFFKLGLNRPLWRYMGQIGNWPYDSRIKRA
jgi:hypothetical protein